MCMGKKIEEKASTGCSGKCAGSGQAKLSDSEIKIQQQECHGAQLTSADAATGESKH